VFGEAGLVTLFTLISVHSLILLTAATVVFELAAAREHAGQSDAAQPPMWRTVLGAVRNGVLHPVPLPILAGLLFARPGWYCPGGRQTPATAGPGPGAVGTAAGGGHAGVHPRGSPFQGRTAHAVAKCVVHPLLLAAMGWALGLSGLPWP
jgi:hypothetical protein